MGTVTTSLSQQAQSIFDDLGYSVAEEGGELRATRKWRVVQVTPMPEPRDPPTTGEMRCFVTWSERVSDLERRILRSDVDYEWAIIGVRDTNDYEVTHRSGG
ncbi:MULTISPECIES: DUF7116 family protein [Salinibaculum]|uniref:DUF7116 family protein n=1 Tax=Salinibaculum TaxID=2732368 RepID=UPI0030CB3AFE